MRYVRSETCCETVCECRRIKRFEILQMQDQAPKAAGNQCCGFMYSSSRSWSAQFRARQNSMRRAGGKKPLIETLLGASALSFEPLLELKFEIYNKVSQKARLKSESVFIKAGVVRRAT